MRYCAILLVFISVILKAEQPIETKKFQKELSKFYGVENMKTSMIDNLSNENDLFLRVHNREIELGIIVLTSAKGRFDKFDYMIIYNTNFEIELIKILVYRSDYGAEITAKRWLSQFYSKQKVSLKYGSDIQAISGATVSASSLTENVNRINKILREYFNN